MSKFKALYILYDGEEDNPGPIDQLVMSQGKKAGGPWEYYHSLGFNGAEAERIVAVTSGGDILEEITRAKTHLAVINMSDERNQRKGVEFFHWALDKGLVELGS